MTLPNYPCQEIQAFGARVANAIFDASIRKQMNGLGGCKPYNLADFDQELHTYIETYLEGNHESVAIMYAAMRTKEKEE